MSVVTIGPVNQTSKMARSWDAAAQELVLSVSHEDYNKWERRRPLKTPLRASTEQKTPTKYLFPLPGTFQNPRPGVDGDRRAKWRPNRQKTEESRTENASTHNRLLRFLIRSRKKTLAEYNVHAEKILKLNLALRRQIEGVDRDSLSETSVILGKYGRYRDAISTVERKFGEDLKQAKEILSQKLAKTSKELKRLEDLLAGIDKRLSVKSSELTFLKKYKDKVFPVRARQIAELRHQLDSLNASNASLMADLVQVIKKERRRYLEEQEVAKVNTETDAADVALAAMDPAVKGQAITNDVMKKEIKMHRKDVTALKADVHRKEEIIRLLEEEIGELQVNVRPLQHQRRPLCLPDMDVVLDIPKQEWLPV